jgi:hypothetical protein
VQSPDAKGSGPFFGLEAIVRCGTCKPQMDQTRDFAVVLEDAKMIALERQRVALFVDPSRQQWIVRDPDGSFWMLPSGADPWDHREPFIPNEETELEPVPGHYKDMLGLPF